MTPDLPLELQRTADILRNSLRMRFDEKAPAPPVSLLEDLTARFEARSAIPATLQRLSIFQKIQSFVSTPAFGMAAAALVILAVALPSVMDTSGGSDTAVFRGGPTEIGDMASASIVLIGAPQGVASTLGASGDFEKGSILSSDTAQGAKVIVDFNSATISAIAADGMTVHSTGIPSDSSALSAAIAEALSKL